MANGSVDLGVPGVEGAVEVGRGGFATVYRARQTELDREVAIKVVTPGLLSPGDDKFVREVRATSRLSQHPNVVPVYGVGTTAAGLSWLMMPYYERGSLADLLDRGGALPEATAVRLGRTLAATLEYVHQQGVVHRDVKPANILMAEGDEPMLGDFGVAKVTTASMALQTVGANVVTWAYGPPEAFTGGQPTAAWDVYSLGATVYAMLTGSPPFVDDEDANIFAVLNRIGNVEVPDLTVRGVSAPVAAAVRQAMAKEPTDRPASAAEFGALLTTRTPPPPPPTAAVVPPAAPAQPPPAAPTEPLAAAPAEPPPVPAAERALDATPEPAPADSGVLLDDTGNRLVLVLAAAAVAVLFVSRWLQVYDWADANSFSDSLWGDTPEIARLILLFATSVAMVVGIVLLAQRRIGDGVAYEWLVGASAASFVLEFGYDFATFYLPKLEETLFPHLLVRVVAGLLAVAVLVLSWRRASQPGPRVDARGGWLLAGASLLVLASVWSRNQDLDDNYRFLWLAVNGLLVAVMLVRALGLPRRTTGAATLVAAGSVAALTSAALMLVDDGPERWRLAPAAIGFALFVVVGVSRWRSSSPAEADQPTVS